MHFGVPAGFVDPVHLETGCAQGDDGVS